MGSYPSNTLKAFFLSSCQGTEPYTLTRNSCWLQEGYVPVPRMKLTAVSLQRYRPAPNTPMPSFRSAAMSACFPCACSAPCRLRTGSLPMPSWRSKPLVHLSRHPLKNSSQVRPRPSHHPWSRYGRGAWGPQPTRTHFRAPATGVTGFT